MIDWAMTRIGTPYSQCLGIDARPQDPECPPGTNRFGAGFFDCSGFVSSAYRRIGITVPATTYAMDADPRFMATRVADRIDLSVMEPGDVFLMDGHTGMYVGGGMIVHAVSGGLTYQPVPGWVANGTYAVLRPSLLL
jgi:cell wall-associated NlpC family hydrolase